MFLYTDFLYSFFSFVSLFLLIEENKPIVNLLSLVLNLRIQMAAYFLSYIEATVATLIVVFQSEIRQ